SATRSVSPSLGRALRNIGAQFPVAVPGDAPQRLQVSEDQFRRRLQFAGAEGALATVYLGKAAGAGEVYARSADSDAIYQLALPLGRVSKQASDWYAMQTAALPESSLKKVVLPGFTLVRGKAGDWGLADKESAQQSLDAAAVAALLRRLTAPEFQSVTKGDAPQGKAAFSYQLVTKKGDAVQFQLFDADQDQPATLVRSDQPWRYQLQPEQLASLEKTSLDGLVAKTQPAGSSQQPQTPTARADEQGAPRPPPSKTAGKPKKAGNTG
ncbi:MAG: DUF4340 domain-containing protein, partial [Salinisphaera sp.]|nr:DUF4340 domain-containing protein [Salinisphaera sp.]